MRIACAQFAPIYSNVEANLSTIEAVVRDTDVDVIVFPELALTGYFFKSPEELNGLAEPLDSITALTLSNIARKHQQALVLGFMEESDGVYYNSALAYDHKGNLAGHYRKIHRFYYETQIFDKGELGFPVFELSTRSGTIRAGLMICYDWRFPEAARALALQGAEVIFLPSNIVTTTGMLHPTLQTRAFENKVVLAFADRVGQETNGEETLTFRGESAIINFNGEVLAKGSEVGTETILAEVDLSKTREKRINAFNDIFLDRDPFQYI